MVARVTLMYRPVGDVSTVLRRLLDSCFMSMEGLIPGKVVELLESGDSYRELRVWGHHR